MKKCYSLAIALLCLCLVGCGEKKPVENPPSAESVERKSSDQENTLFGSVIYRDTVTSGSGEAIGSYAYVDMRKATMQRASYDEISEAFDMVASLKDKYNYFYFFFEDDTGILFAECDREMPLYGLIQDRELTDDVFLYVEDYDTFFSINDEDGNPVTDAEEPTGINGLNEVLE